MGSITINGKTYSTIQKKAPKMTKAQSKAYTTQVGQMKTSKSKTKKGKS